MEKILFTLKELDELVASKPASRELSLARTKLDECRLWLNEHMRKVVQS